MKKFIYLKKCPKILLPIAIMVEFIMRAKGDQRAKTDTITVENLCACILPNCNN
jgi:hypothetical protein